MRRLIPVLSLLALLPVASSWAQLSPPNKAGVTMGLLSYYPMPRHQMSDRQQLNLCRDHRNLSLPRMFLPRMVRCD